MLKTVLETLDGLEETVSKLYSEQSDGRFILQIEGIDAHPDVVNLKNAYERVKQDKSKAIDERDTFKAKVESLPEDFDPKVWEKAKDGKGDEAKLVELRSEYEAKIAEQTARADAAEQNLNRFAVERDLSDALITAGITDAGLSKGARAMLASLVKAGDDGTAIVESDMGPLPVGEYVKKWAAGEGKAFVTPPKGGERGGSGDSAKPGNKNPLLDKVPALADLPEK